MGGFLVVILIVLRTGMRLPRRTGHLGTVVECSSGVEGLLRDEGGKAEGGYWCGEEGDCLAVESVFLSLRRREGGWMVAGGMGV